MCPIPFYISPGLTVSLTVKEKYGSDYEGSGSEEETDSEEDVSEDEDGEELTPAVDAAILRTLARIKRKDPAIYDAQKPVFEGGHMLCTHAYSIDLAI